MIERRWAREWREYRYVTPKYMKKFALNPPCSRPPLAPGQEADLTSLKHGEDYPDEWAKRQAKLRTLEEQEQREELAVRTLMVKHLAYAQASLPWISLA